MSEHRKPIIWLLVCVTLVTTLVIGGIGFGVYWFISKTVDDRDIVIAKAIGDQVVEAITAYKEEHEDLPSQLSDLVPDYLESIPTVDSSGTQWTYTVRKEGDRYDLSHDWGFWGPVIYTSGNRWSVDTK